MTASQAEELAQRLAAMDLTPDERREALAVLDIENVSRSWQFWARPEQLEPPGDDWTVWLIQTGRRWGKGRTAAEYMIDRCQQGRARVGALMNRTITDVRAVQIEGESGLVARAWARGLTADYVSSHRSVYIRDGRDTLATFELFSAQEPDGPRGRGFDTAWADELGAWPAKVGPSGETGWSNLLLAMSAGEPKLVVSTTPKPTKAMIDLNQRAHTHITRGSLYENVSNLADAFVTQIVDEYSGTRLAAQEIEGILLLTVEGALWTADALNLDRWAEEPGPRRYTVVGVDPPSEQGTCGIVVCSAYRVTGATRGESRVDIGTLADYSIDGGPDRWAPNVVRAIRDYGCDEVVAERNQGGEMVRSTLRAAGIVRTPINLIRATVNKQVRAEPIAVLSDRHRVHMIGDHPLLEGQLTSWVPGLADWSPDRLDAFVHAAERLRRFMGGGARRTRPTGTIPGVHVRPGRVR